MNFVGAWINKLPPHLGMLLNGLIDIVTKLFVFCSMLEAELSSGWIAATSNEVNAQMLKPKNGLEDSPLYSMIHLFSAGVVSGFWRIPMRKTYCTPLSSPWVRPITATSSSPRQDVTSTPSGKTE